MKELFHLSPSDDERPELQNGLKNTAIKLIIASLVGVSISSALAGSIRIGEGEVFELGSRVYDVGTCAQDSVQIDTKVEPVGALKYLSEITVSGISPILCNDRVITLRPFDTSNNPIKVVDINGGEPDLDYLQVFISGNEFRAVRNGFLSDSSTALLSLTTGSARIRLSNYETGTSVVNLFSGGTGKTLKSSEDTLSSLAISFQIQLTPKVQVEGYDRTEIEISLIGP